jgi:SAM-dependent methyltransferase
MSQFSKQPNINDAWAGAFASFDDLQKVHTVYGYRCIDWVLRILCHGESLHNVLDVGCGAGFYFTTFAQMGGKNLYGLEYDPANVVGARRLNQGLPVDIRQGDIRQLPLPFPDIKFDCIVTMGLVEHFSYPIPNIRKMGAMLSEKGFLLISIPNFRNPFYYRHNARIKDELPFHLWWGMREWVKVLGKMENYRIEAVQCCNIWSSYHLWPRILRKLTYGITKSCFAMDWEIEITNRLLPTTGEAIFIKLRRNPQAV